MTEIVHPTRDCRGCPAVDDHPRVAYGFYEVDAGDGINFTRKPAYYHYDCLTPAVKDDIFRGDEQTDRQKGLAQIVAHAEGGGVEHLHGDELRQKVVEIMGPINEAELAAQQEAESNG